MIRRVRSAFSVCACFRLMIGRAACPVIDDRTRPVVQRAYWTQTGRWHCSVQSVLQRVRSLFSCALLRLDQHVRSVTGPARPFVRSASGHCFAVSRYATGVSGQLDQRVRSVLRDIAVARSTRPVSLTSASGQRDFGCLSF
jgi:hypothetical protein